jgi:hypothetical protein
MRRRGLPRPHPAVPARDRLLVVASGSDVLGHAEVAAEVRPMADSSTAEMGLPLQYGEDTGPPRAELQQALDAVQRLSKLALGGAQARRRLPEARATAARLAFACGMTVTDLAAKMGVRPGTASKLLTGAEVEQACRASLGGRAHRLTLYHFFELESLSSQNDRDRFVLRAIQDSLSQRALHDLVSLHQRRLESATAGPVTREQQVALRIIKAQFPQGDSVLVASVARACLGLRKVSAETLHLLAEAG